MNQNDRLMALERKAADEIGRMDAEIGNTNPVLLMVPMGDAPVFRIDSPPGALLPELGKCWAHPSLRPQNWSCRVAFKAGGREVRMLVPEAFARLIDAEEREAQEHREYLIVIDALVQEQHRPPTYREIAERVGCSVSVVQLVLNRMQAEDLIHRRPNKHRTLTITTAGRWELEQHPKEVA